MNDYSYHQTMLADPGARLPVTEDDPQPGRYRVKRGSEWRAVAIWFGDDKALNFIMDGQTVAEEMQAHIWTGCARYPISEKEYDRMMNEGGNDPVYSQLPADANSLRIRVERLAAIPAVIVDPDDARMIADIAHVLKQIEKTCDEKQKSLSKPHKDAIASIREAWGLPTELAISAREPFMRALSEHLKQKNEPGGVRGQVGRAISLRSYQALEITDYESALQHFVKADPEAFSETIEKLARKALKAGETVPGAKFTEDRRAQ